MKHKKRGAGECRAGFSRYAITLFCLCTITGMIVMGSTADSHAHRAMPPPITAGSNHPAILSLVTSPCVNGLSNSRLIESNLFSRLESDGPGHISGQPNPNPSVIELPGLGDFKRLATRDRETDYPVFLVLISSLLLFVLIGTKLLLRKMKHIERQRRVINDRILHTKKMTSISQLSVGIAHEINNPLACIKEEAGWMQDILSRENMQNIPDHDELMESLREIDRQAGRCREITHKLLSFGRKMDSEIERIDINRLIEELVRLKERDAALLSIRFIRNYENKLPLVLADPSQLRQVFFNLINNAMEAIHAPGGEIRITTRKEKGDRIRVVIDDTGTGIPYENQHKVFDPFFTTKETGKGTGLGLSICHGIIERVGGTISMTSEVGRGTTFTVTLPLKQPDIDTEKA